MLRKIRKQSIIIIFLIIALILTARTNVEIFKEPE